MTLFEAYTESKKTQQESGVRYRGHAIYRKATGLIVEFRSAKPPHTNNSAYPFPTIEDMEADDWEPVTISSVQNAIMNASTN